MATVLLSNPLCQDFHHCWGGGLLPTLAQMLGHQASIRSISGAQTASPTKALPRAVQLWAARVLKPCPTP